MRTLEELNEIKKYILETNKFENISLYMGYSNEEQIDKYIEKFELDNSFKELLINYYRDINNTTDITAVKILNNGAQMLLHNDEVNEYCKLCIYSSNYYFIEDMEELNEGEYVAKEYRDLYAKAVENGRYYLKDYMSYIEEHDEYVFDQSYKSEHYRFAKDDSRWHRKEDVTEVSDMPQFAFNRNTQTNYTQYIYSQDYLDEYYREDENGIYRLMDNMEYVECDEIWIFDRNYLNDNYRYCDECNNWVNIDDGEYLENYDIWVCNDCIEEHYSATCEICGERIRDGREYYIEDENGYEQAVCEECYNEDAAFRIDRYESASNYIGGYHCNNGVWKKYFCDDEDENVILYGHELEIEPKPRTKYNLSKAATAALDNLNCILSHDGSLNNNGFEIVSQPQSYKYLMEHYSTYERVFKEIVENGYVSHNSTHCGLHFHVTAPKENRDEIVGRLWLIIETFKEQFQALSRRRGDFSWCHFLSQEGQDSVYKIAKIAKEENEDKRYLVINDRNPETIEIRLFRGTLNPKTFFADLQLVHNLFKIAYNLELPLTEVTFDMLIEGDIISEYCKENNIYSDKRIKDESAKYIVIENKILNLTKNIMDMIWKKVETDKDLQQKQINKKKASEENVYEYLDELARTSKRISTSIKYYVTIKRYYDKKQIENIAYNLTDIKFYFSDEAINKKINKINSYSKELSA